MVTRIKDVQRAMSELAREADTLDELAIIIHRPESTTVAEAALVNASLAALQRYIELAQNHCRQLIEAATYVGEKAIDVSARYSEKTVIDITRLSLVPVKQFSFFIKSIAENDLWDEAELHLSENGCNELLMSGGPVAAVQKMLQNKIAAGEALTPRGRRVALCDCRSLVPPGGGGGGSGPPGGGGDAGGGDAGGGDAGGGDGGTPKQLE